MALYGRMCSFVIVYVPLCSLVWPFHGLVAVVGHFYGRLWQNIDFIGLVSSLLAVIDPNSFGLV